MQSNQFDQCIALGRIYGSFLRINRYSTCQKQGKGLLKVTDTLKQIKVVYKTWWLVGMNLIGPLKETSRENRYILTTVDYFTKWVGAVSIPSRDDVTVAKALYEHIYFRHGARHPILTDNGGESFNAVRQEIFSASAR
jgi:hypothetical protein